MDKFQGKTTCVYMDINVSACVYTMLFIER